MTFVILEPSVGCLLLFHCTEVWSYYMIRSFVFSLSLDDMSSVMDTVVPACTSIELFLYQNLLNRQADNLIVKYFACVFRGLLYNNDFLLYNNDFLL